MGRFKIRGPETFKSEREVDQYYNALLEFVGPAFEFAYTPLPDVVIGSDIPFTTDAERADYTTNTINLKYWNAVAAQANELTKIKGEL